MTEEEMLAGMMAEAKRNPAMRKQEAAPKLPRVRKAPAPAAAPKVRLTATPPKGAALPPPSTAPMPKPEPTPRPTAKNAPARRVAAMAMLAARVERPVIEAALGLPAGGLKAFIMEGLK